MAYSVYCTLTTDVEYTFWGTSQEGQALTPARMIRINGKANLPNKTLLTPRGAVTAVTDEEIDALNGHPVFQMHKRNGFVTIEKRGQDIDKVVSDMVPRDESSPLEPGDFDESMPQPTISQQQAEEREQPEESASRTPGAGTKMKRANTTRGNTKKKADE